MNRKMKRALAYIIDFIFVLCVITIIYIVLPKSDEILSIQANMNQLNEQILKEEITFSTYFQEYSALTHSLDKSNFGFYIIILVIIHLYFVAIPIFTNGRTVGMYLFQLRIVEKNKEKVSALSLWIRNLIINGLFYFLFLVIFTCTLKDTIYFISVTILGIIQILLVISSIFMILYRKDYRGLQDIFSNSKVIEEVKA